MPIMPCLLLHDAAQLHAGKREYPFLVPQLFIIVPSLSVLEDNIFICKNGTHEIYGRFCFFISQQKIRVRKLHQKIQVYFKIFSEIVEEVGFNMCVILGSVVASA
jgi:hypothetical protein